MTESQPAPAKQRNWVPCGCLLVMFLTCVFVPVVTYVAWSYRAAGQVKTQIARIRAAGLPTDFDELNEFYRIESGAEDATLLYLAAQNEFSGSIYEADCLNLPIIGNSELKIPPPGQPWAEQQAVAEFLAKYDEGLRNVHQAAAAGGAARFPLKFEDGFAMLLPHAQNMRGCARMLALEAHVKAHQGDAKGAADAIIAMATISRSLENQPILVSQLVRIAIHGMAASLVGELLPHVDFSDEDLQGLQEAFRRDDFKAGIVHALNGERVMGADAFKNPAGALGPGSGLPQGRIIRASNEDLALYLEIQADLHAAAELPYPDSFAAAVATDIKIKNAIASPLGGMRYMMSALILPAVEAAVGAAARADGANRCIDAAIAIEQFRRREGKLPATLNELVPDFLPAVPIDPFDGQAIRYVIKSDSYLIYTCGLNRVDDGGVEDEAWTDAVIRIDLKSSAVEAPPAATPGNGELANPKPAVESPE